MGYQKIKRIAILINSRGNIKNVKKNCKSGRKKEIM